MDHGVNARPIMLDKRATLEHTPVPFGIHCSPSYGNLVGVSPAPNLIKFIAVPILKHVKFKISIVLVVQKKLDISLFLFKLSMERAAIDQRVCVVVKVNGRKKLFLSRFGERVLLFEQRSSILRSIARFICQTQSDG